VLEELSGDVFGSVRQRVARHLLDLADRREATASLVARASQQELADAVGSVREVVARVLGELRRQGLIEPGPGGIRLLDAQGLFTQTLSEAE
jgi:CRP/FNR family transcriptional regulator